MMQKMIIWLQSMKIDLRFHKNIQSPHSQHVITTITLSHCDHTVLEQYKIYKYCVGPKLGLDPSQ